MTFLYRRHLVFLHSERKKKNKSKFRLGKNIVNMLTYLERRHDQKRFSHTGHVSEWFPPQAEHLIMLPGTYRKSENVIFSKLNRG